MFYDISIIHSKTKVSIQTICIRRDLGTSCRTVLIIQYLSFLFELTLTSKMDLLYGTSGDMN
jgi:hypothetical protein